MPVKRQHRRSARPSRRGAAQRLTAALETLTRQDARTTAAITVAELCRVADVSRNSLYRYHAPILKALREHQRHGPQAAHKRTHKSVERRRLENIALHEAVAKLAALVDHYYAAYRETAGLLERRDRELAELRSRSAVKPALLTAPGHLAVRGNVTGTIAPPNKRGPSA
jgi:hypothetical protein